MSANPLNDLSTLFFDTSAILQASDIGAVCSYKWSLTKSLENAKELLREHRFGMIFIYMKRDSELDLADALLGVVERDKERWQALQTLVVLCHPNPKNPAVEKLRTRVGRNDLRVISATYLDACCVSSDGERLYFADVDARRGDNHSFPDGRLPWW